MELLDSEDCFGLAPEVAPGTHARAFKFNPAARLAAALEGVVGV